MADYSTNLLGIFKKEHLSIQLTEKGKEEYNIDCEPDAKIVPPKFNEHFESVTNRKWFYINIKSILNRKFHLQRMMKALRLYALLLIHL